MSTPARDNEEKFDRISYLPDELLCHVLSFLTTKEAALTSVLSKRWRNQLAFVPNLDLDDSVFLHPIEGKWDKEEIIQSFMDFVDRMLVVQGNSSIKKASLKFQNAVDSDRVNSWICNVLQRCVLDMDLYIKLGYNYRLPSEIFMSRTLVVLKISGRFPVLMRPGHFWLPMLKTLALDLVTLYGAQFQILLSACPALEELYMRNFTVSNGDETVSSPTLKTLTIKTGNLLHALSFDAPNLVCLKYSVVVLNDYPLVNLENLVEAHIKLQSTNTHNNVRKLVRGIRNIQKLYLSPSALEVVVALCSPESPRFNNLTFLDIDCRLNTTWQAMHVFLQKCPHLETLVFKGLLHHVSDECGDSCICISREN